VTVVVQPGRGRGPFVGTVATRAREWIPALVVFVLAIAAWQLSIQAFHIERFLLPKPLAIVTRFWDSRDELWRAGWFTFKEALGGFAIGSAAAVVFALVLARFRRVGAALMPVAIAANAIPIIAFAPIFNAWFDPLQPTSKMAVAAVLCFFPVMVNTLRGLTSVRPTQIELMRSYGAGHVAIFRRVRIPTALPFLFSALKVATVLAMIGAIVGEYFGGSQEALGIRIKNSAALFDFETAWAAILVASILGIAFYVAVALLERLALQWDPTRQERGSG
jgi:NitT/TauT family transport system permease protein